MAKQLFFPEFCKTRTIPSANVRMFDSPHSRYNIIIGRDILVHGFILHHAQNVITWDSLSVPMPETSTSSSTSTTFQTNFHAHIRHLPYLPLLRNQYYRRSTNDPSHKMSFKHAYIFRTCNRPISFIFKQNFQNYFQES